MKVARHCGLAACTKDGGLSAQGLTISGVSLSMGLSSLLVMLPTALALIAWFGQETRGRDLRDLDADHDAALDSLVRRAKS